MDEKDGAFGTPEQHAAHYLALAEEIWPETFSTRREAAYDRLDREYGHLCQSLSYLIERGDGERAERMLRVLRDFWWARCRLLEGREWIARVFAALRFTPFSITRAAVLDHAGALAFAMSDHDAARKCFEESLAIRRKIGTKPEVASSLHHLANVIRWGHGDTELARVLLEECLAHVRGTEDRVMTGAALMPLGALAVERGDIDLAHTLLAEGIAIFAAVQLTMGFPLSLQEFAALAAVEGQPGRALRLFGAGAKQHERLATIQLPYIRAWVEGYAAIARQALSKEDVDAAWAEGQALSLEQAIAYALGERTVDRPER